MDDDTLRRLLPESIAARLRSLKQTDGRVIAVLDATGLTADARDGLEAAVKDILAAQAGVSDFSGYAVDPSQPLLPDLFLDP